MPRMDNPPGARIATGTYTGDGSLSLAITGVGFAPQLVKIVPRPAAAGPTMMFEKWASMAGAYALSHITTANNEHYSTSDSIIALGTDGFTVDDNGIDAHPNKNGQVYEWLAIG